MDSKPLWVHEVGDGRGLRHVYLNGQRVKTCVYADEKEGIIVCFDDPPKLNDAKDDVIRHEKRGDVKVIFV